jgi:hypothetical protein
VGERKKTRKGREVRKGERGEKRGEGRKGGREGGREGGIAATLEPPQKGQPYCSLCNGNFGTQRSSGLILS